MSWSYKSCGLLLLGMVIALSSVEMALGQPGGKGGPGGGPGGKPKAVVVLGKVTNTVPVVSKRYTGLFEPIEKYVVIARVSGKIRNITFKEGEMVKRGDVLFEIEDEEWKANVEVAQASVDSAAASILQYEARIKEVDALIQYKENTYNRNKDLYTQNNAVSKDDMENTLSALEAARAQRLASEALLKEAKASLRLAEANLILKQLDLDRTKIKSEITGKAGRVTYTLGNYVTPSSSPLVTISQIDPIYVKFTMSERDFTNILSNLEQLKRTSSIRIMLANGAIYDQKATIAFYDNMVDTATDSITVWAKLDNPKKLLNPGGIAKVILDLKGKTEEPCVPISAVLHDSKGEYLYVVGPDGTAKSRRIVLGTASEQTQCITSGVKEGETIVIDGTHKVMEGMEVVDESVMQQAPGGPAAAGMPGAATKPAPAGIPAPSAKPAAAEVPATTPAAKPDTASVPVPSTKPAPTGTPAPPLSPAPADSPVPTPNAKPVPTGSLTPAKGE